MPPSVPCVPLCNGEKYALAANRNSGERFTERILTVTRTCRLQGKNPFHFLCDLMDAAFNNNPRPSLV